MRQRVASIYPTRPDQVERAVNESWQLCRDEACAAIAAMREPLEWMILRADRKAERVFGDRETNLDPHGTWQVMIDAALGGFDGA